VFETYTYKWSHKWGLDSRIARRTGQTYKFSGFSGQGMRQFVLNELARNNIQKYEPVFAPINGKTHNNVLSG
jgi:hypothetical protein